METSPTERERTSNRKLEYNVKYVKRLCHD